ncbi:Ig-like domain-containing protein [Mycolicibacterium sp.]|uniref:L,D-transpeptidase n=1 Tax=Mycolicibacterium sp. TaxID=2320850 RepID=UPI001D724BB6|nr:Ig-like domain-containing protein [Mycolicibacterium sp.]MCB1290284.1 L,D-transpeptidase family protein [Mycobacterium sp.]MCB9409203.1 L,D-transpeptidase [Mycolicibacterium sp.]
MRHVVTVARARFGPLMALLLLIPALVLGMSGCGSRDSGPQVLVGKGTPYGNLLVPKLTATVEDGAVGVPVDQPITLSVQGGVLGTVSMLDQDGEAVEGVMSPDGLSWSAAEPLGYNKRYTITAQSLGLGGIVSEAINFKSHSPANLTMPYLSPGDGAVVGVGQPIAVRFDESIPDRLAAEKAITVVTDPPVEGAFYWLSNSEVRWRPQNFWEPGTRVTVKVNTYGVDLGEGLYGQENLSSSFSIGDRLIATADDNTKMLTIRRNGEVVKTMPISMGKDSTPTNNGTFIIGDRYQRLIMDSSTYGVPTNSPDGYRLEVDWATQMSYSGIYVHSAPWSVGAQGSANTSHGCLNVSPENAKWFYNNTKRGDVVEVQGTVGSVLSGVEGLGDWNIPWSQWKAGNAKA